MRLETNKHCFACGVENPIGLKLEFRFEPRPDGGEDYVTEFTPRREHQGYVGMTHGGIITTVLDEVMARLAWVKDIPAITAKMEVRLRSRSPWEPPLPREAELFRIEEGRCSPPHRPVCRAARSQQKLPQCF